MDKQPFIIFEEDGYTHCMRRKYPHYVARLEAIKQGISENLAGYDLYLVLKGTISDGNVASYNIIDMEHTLASMGEWFLANEIYANENRYKSFKF